MDDAGECTPLGVTLQVGAGGSKRPSRPVELPSSGRKAHLGVAESVYCAAARGLRASCNAPQAVCVGQLNKYIVGLRRKYMVAPCCYTYYIEK